MNTIVPLRDDGFRLWNALHDYVKGVVKFAYPSDQVGQLTSESEKPCQRVSIAVRKVFAKIWKVFVILGPGRPSAGWA